MRCRRLLCGDCCVLTEGGVKVYALCRSCARGEGRTLGPRWAGVGVVLGLVLLGLVLLNVAVSLVAGRW